MTVYEMRTYTLHVGKMGEAVHRVRHRPRGGWTKLIGYFGRYRHDNQLVIVKFDDDNTRRALGLVFDNKVLVRLCREIPPVARVAGLLLTAAPWGPHP
jgi:hypothetical protein